MATWTVQTRMAGLPEDVLAVLAQPDAIACWAPIDSDLVDFDRDRVGGRRPRARAGTAGGRSAEFEVVVDEANDGRLALAAVGPIRLDVEYLAVAAGDGSDVQASVTVSGRGPMGRILAQATDALLPRRAPHGGQPDRLRARAGAGHLTARADAGTARARCALRLVGDRLGPLLGADHK